MNFMLIKKTCSWSVHYCPCPPILWLIQTFQIFVLPLSGSWPTVRSAPWIIIWRHLRRAPGSPFLAWSILNRPRSHGRSPRRRKMARKRSYWRPLARRSQFTRNGTTKGRVATRPEMKMWKKIHGERSWMQNLGPVRMTKRVTRMRSLTNTKVLCAWSKQGGLSRICIP